MQALEPSAASSSASVRALLPMAFRAVDVLPGHRVLGLVALERAAHVRQQLVLVEEQPGAVRARVLVEERDDDDREARALHDREVVAVGRARAELHDLVRRAEQLDHLLGGGLAGLQLVQARALQRDVGRRARDEAGGEAEEQAGSEDAHARRYTPSAQAEKSAACFTGWNSTTRYFEIPASANGSRAKNASSSALSFARARIIPPVRGSCGPDASSMPERKPVSRCARCSASFASILSIAAR